MAKTISIIVPVYRVEAYLDDCLRSLVAQSYPHLEIIVIDNGSPDRCPMICDEWAARDERIRVIHWQQNRTLSGARNGGLEAATGEYLCFVDSDDVVDSRLCERVIDAFEATNADVVTFGHTRVTEKGDVLQTVNGTAARWNREQALTALYAGELQSYVWDKAYTRDVWDGVRFPIGRAFEDVGTMYKVLLKADTVCGIPDRLYYYRKRKYSITTTMSTATLRDMFLMRRQSYEDMLAVYPSVAALCFRKVARGAKAYIDRCFWDDTATEALTQAEAFLHKHKEAASALGMWELRFYLRSPKCYRVYRLLKHRVGCIARRVLPKK